jgi:hypothetical protein
MNDRPKMNDRPETATLTMTFHFLLWGVEEGGNSPSRIMSAAEPFPARFGKAPAGNLDISGSPLARPRTCRDVE